ncbi:MAG: NgoFVII family restriction endonuclease [Turicibacter sp.]|nr:NgoFVII family restriction endonuclease [Turicibacter sp.]
MSVWEKYTQKEREEYIKFLQVYGALSNLFRQKQGDMIPYLDSKFQETVYGKVFQAKNVDIGNTPHDVLSVFGQERIGIGLKTWMNSKPSYQKVMQLKRFKNEIESSKTLGIETFARKISEIKNERMLQDYIRLGLQESKNIYHYVTRDEGRFVLHETTYPLVDLDKLCNFKMTDSSFEFSDGHKDYKYTFGDSQIWMRFAPHLPGTTKLTEFDVNIMDDPFDFLMRSYFEMSGNATEKDEVEITVAYLPLYSYRTKEVGEKSGLNAWNGASKNKGSGTLRPLNEVYIPIPKEFHKKFPDFFTDNILELMENRKQLKGSDNRPEVKFELVLPNGTEMPALLTGDGLKNFQSGSNVITKPNGKRYGQADLGQWLLVDVLGLKERTLVTREWLHKKGTDSVKLWYENGNPHRIYIDFAPIGAFEAFMNNEGVVEDGEIE